MGVTLKWLWHNIFPPVLRVERSSTSNMTAGRLRNDAREVLAAVAALMKGHSIQEGM